MTRRYYINKKAQKDVNINLTTFIDILFVLLITFMLPSQMLFGNVKINLPTADAEIVVLKKDPVKVMIDENANIFVNEEHIKNDNLIQKIDELTFKDVEAKIYVMADKANNYGEILNVVGKINNAGYIDVMLITDIHNRI